MPNIDIAVPPELNEMFALPACADIKLPKPEPLTIHLPTGGTLKAFTDISKGIPTDCSMTLSLLLQIGPLLASMDCLLKILKLLKPLIDVIKGLPFPPVKAISDFIAAAKDLVPCLLIPTPAVIAPFVKDILCLILKVLTCVVGQLKSIVEIMSGLQIQLKVAIKDGNGELQTALQCAQDNAATAASHLTQSIEPIAALLELVSPLLQLAGQKPLQLPGIGGATDVEALKTVVTTLEGVKDAIKVVTDALGGC
jgi:hypothetical protein